MQNFAGASCVVTALSSPGAAFHAESWLAAILAVVAVLLS